MAQKGPAKELSSKTYMLMSKRWSQNKAKANPKSTTCLKDYRTIGTCPNIHANGERTATKQLLFAGYPERKTTEKNYKSDGYPGLRSVTQNVYGQFCNGARVSMVTPMRSQDFRSVTQRFVNFWATERSPGHAKCSAHLSGRAVWLTRESHSRSVWSAW